MTTFADLDAPFPLPSREITTLRSGTALCLFYAIDTIAIGTAVWSICVQRVDRKIFRKPLILEG
jgi:hypothetical protein